MNTGGPRCPNHLVNLTLTNTKGIGICPLSGCRFAYKADESKGAEKVKLDAFGNMKRDNQYSITPLDGDGG